MILNLRRLFAVACILLATGAAARAQFATVINVPPDLAPNAIGSDTQLNMFDGGSTTGSSFRVGAADGSSSNSEVNIFGGVSRGVVANAGSTVNVIGGVVATRFPFGNSILANSGSIVNVVGGNLGHRLSATSGSELNISGGAFGDVVVTSDGSVFNLLGSDFRLDGVLIGGVDAVGNTRALNVPSNSVLSGTLADGTPFAFSSLDRTAFETESIADGTLTIHAAALPALGPNFITASTDAIPLGIRLGQTLLVDAGGTVRENFNAGRGSAVRVEVGGTVGANAEAVGSMVEIIGGTVGSGFDAFHGSTVNISGGSIGSFFQALAGSTVSISGGSVGSNFSADAGSVVRISGGTVGSNFNANSGSIVDVSGGNFGSPFYAYDGSAVNISGGEFRLDGALIGGLETVGDTLAFDLSAGSLLSGTLADGTPFALSPIVQDNIADGTLMLQIAALPPIGPTLIVASTDNVPLGIRAGQTLAVDAGGIVNDNFNAGQGSAVRVETGGAVGANATAVAATVDVMGGTVGDYFVAFDGSSVNISSGSVGWGFSAYSGSIVNISGGVVGQYANAGSTVNIFSGAVGDEFEALDGSTINISGGSIGRNFLAASGSAINISGGSVGRNLVASGGSMVDISGGTFGLHFEAHSGSSVSISGGEFRLDGDLISGLNIEGSSLPVNLPADSVLSGTLADGTPFAFSRIRVVQDHHDNIANGVITLNVSSLPLIGPPFITAPNEPVPSGIRNGQVLVVNSGGAVRENFNAGRGSTVRVRAGGVVAPHLQIVSAVLEVSGGSIGEYFRAVDGSTVNIYGGTIGHFSIAHGGSTVNLSGGSIGANFWVSGHATMNMTGGQVGLDFRATSSTVNITGGTVNTTFYAADASTVNMSGGMMSGNLFVFGGSTVEISGDSVVTGLLLVEDGSVANISGGIFDRVEARRGGAVTISGGSFAAPVNLVALAGSTVNLKGSKFSLVDMPIEGVAIGEPYILSERSGTLSGRFADGSAFAFQLTSFSPDARLTLTVIPEPSSALLVFMGVVVVFSSGSQRSRFLRFSRVTGSAHRERNIP